jgi:outer membrane lipoprotein
MENNTLKVLFPLVLAGTVLALSGCVSIPSPLAGDYPDFQPHQATERSVGARVRWGGNIVETLPSADQTCVEILARDLSREHRPLPGDHQHGRFLACRQGFQDPAVFTEGREITVIGVIDGFDEGEIGEFMYRYPRLNAETIYLWPMRTDRLGYYPDHWVPYYYYDPWWPYRHPYHRVPRSRISGSVIITR